MPDGLRGKHVSMRTLYRQTLLRLTRREFLDAAARLRGSLLLMSAPASRLSAKPRFERYPFTLGVAQRSELEIRIGLSGATGGNGQNRTLRVSRFLNATDRRPTSLIRLFVKPC